MTAAADVLLNLPELRWRGLRAPCELAPFTGAHEQAERVIPYRDAAGHDHVRRVAYKFKAKLWFVETIEPGSFPENFQKWLEALEDGTSGDLLHPIRGKIRCRPLAWEVDYSSKNRGGVTVDVDWTETVDDFDSPTELATLDLDPSAVAEAADQAAAAFDIAYPDGLKNLSLAETVAAIEGGIFSASLSLSAAWNQVAGAASQMVSAIDALDNVEAWPAHDTLVQAFNTFADLGRKAERLAARPTAVLQIDADSTLDAVATQTSNTTEDLMGLNLDLLSSPIIPRGSRVTYYTA